MERPAHVFPGLSASPLTVCVGEGRLRVTSTLVALGRDLILIVHGGQAHVGAVAVRSPAGGTHGEAAAAVVLIPGHKEGPLAQAGAARLAEATGRTCVAIAGIHQEAATREEIDAIVANAQTGIEQLVAHLARLGSAAGDGVP